MLIALTPSAAGRGWSVAPTVLVISLSTKAFAIMNLLQILAQLPLREGGRERGRERERDLRLMSIPSLLTDLLMISDDHPRSTARRVFSCVSLICPTVSTGCAK